jgi:hypothetical protein
VGCGSRRRGSASLRVLTPLLRGCTRLVLDPERSVSGRALRRGWLRSSGSRPEKSVSTDRGLTAGRRVTAPVDGACPAWYRGEGFLRTTGAGIVVLLSVRSSGTKSPTVGLVRTGRKVGRATVSTLRKSRVGRAWGASMTRTSRRAALVSTGLRAANPICIWSRLE